MTLPTFASVLAVWTARRGGPPPTLRSDDPWTAAADLGALRLRAMDGDPARDLPALRDFAGRLGAHSRALFCPYPWDEGPAALDAAFTKACANARARIDAMVLLHDGAACVGHAFLWKAGGNPHSAADGVQIPELGVAVADAWQGHGLGGLLVRWLQALAVALHRDAVELTTAMDNDHGWSTYCSAGFEHIGSIRTPLGVDVTAATLGQASASRWRVERQMVWIIQAGQRARVLASLDRKRREAEGLG